MCTSCDETSKVFAVEIVTKDPVNKDMDLFKEIANRLFQNKIISNINIGNNKDYVVDDRQLFGFELHLSNKHDPLTVNLANVENALTGILDQFEDYHDMRIILN